MSRLIDDGAVVLSAEALHTFTQPLLKPRGLRNEINIQPLPRRI